MRMMAGIHAGRPPSGCKVLSALRRFPRRSVKRTDPTTIRFLHIGKAAGTQMANVMRQVNAAAGRHVFAKMGHDVRLKDIPDSAPYLFSIRWPVSRFKSGFYSRKRRGQPLLHAPWSRYESKAFARFEDANDLAEALFEPGQKGYDATAAILSITHPSMNQVSWFERCGTFLAVRPPIWIIRQEHFETDLRILLQKTGYHDAISLADDPAARHANDYEGIPPLSRKAIENLERWYAQDIAFYNMCSDWLESYAERDAAIAEKRQTYATRGRA